MELIFATHNSGKREEVNRILGRDRFTVLDLNMIGITEAIEETGKDLEANAILKAKYVYSKTSAHVFADDTGLEVYALDMAPGVYSARYAGEDGDATANMKKLLAALRGIENRKARFRTVIALVFNSEWHLFEGIVEGRIAEQAIGKGGFGYDPVFIPEGYDKTFAEMTMEEKNLISHRSKALQEMIQFFE